MPRPAFAPFFQFRTKKSLSASKSLIEIFFNQNEKTIESAQKENVKLSNHESRHYESRTSVRKLPCGRESKSYF